VRHYVFCKIELPTSKSVQCSLGDRNILFSVRQKLGETQTWATEHSGADWEQVICRFQEKGLCRLEGFYSKASFHWGWGHAIMNVYFVGA
jgi:hypothetical protein